MECISDTSAPESPDQLNQELLCSPELLAKYFLESGEVKEDTDKKLLLAVQQLYQKFNISLPRREIGADAGASVSGKAATQHLVKDWVRIDEESLPLPPTPLKRGRSHSMPAAPNSPSAVAMFTSPSGKASKESSKADGGISAGEASALTPHDTEPMRYPPEAKQDAVRDHTILGTGSVHTSEEASTISRPSPLQALPAPFGSQYEPIPYIRSSGTQRPRAEINQDSSTTQSSSWSKTVLSRSDNHETEVDNTAHNYQSRNTSHNRAQSGPQQRKMPGQATIAFHNSRNLALPQLRSKDDLLIDLTNNTGGSAQRKRQRVEASSTSKDLLTSRLPSSQNYVQQLHRAMAEVFRLKRCIYDTQQSNQHLMRVAMREESAKRNLASQVDHLENHIAQEQITKQHLIRETEHFVGTNIEKDGTIQHLKAKLEQLEQSYTGAESTKLKIAKDAAVAYANIAATVAAREYEIRAGVNDMGDTPEKSKVQVKRLTDFSDDTSLIVNRMVDGAMAEYQRFLGEEEFEAMKTEYVRSRHEREAENFHSKGQDRGSVEL